MLGSVRTKHQVDGQHFTLSATQVSHCALENTENTFPAFVGVKGKSQ